jgi:hypothetical protein
LDTKYIGTKVVILGITDRIESPVLAITKGCIHDHI